MTDDQRIEALEQALRECAEAALDRIEVHHGASERAAGIYKARAISDAP
jgi:hypothetical protein